MGLLAGAGSPGAHAPVAGRPWRTTCADRDRVGGLGPAGRSRVVRFGHACAGSIRRDVDPVLHAGPSGTRSASHHLAAAFLRDGHQVSVLDTLQRPGTEKNLDWLQSLPHAARLRFIHADVRDTDLVRSVVGDRDVQAVYHFAAQTAVTTSVVAPRE